MRRNGPAVIGQLPCAPGVYRFRDALGRVLYVGRATTLRSRVARTGRTCVCRWSQRACSMPGAAGALAVTPHAWGDFMQRTAELAAKMAGLGPCPPSLPWHPWDCWHGTPGFQHDGYFLNHLNVAL